MLEFVNEVFFNQLYQIEGVLSILKTEISSGVTDAEFTERLGEVELNEVRTKLVGGVTQLLTAVEKALSEAEQGNLPIKQFVERCEFLQWFFDDNIYHPSRLGEGYLLEEDLRTYNTTFNRLNERFLQLRVMPESDVAIASELKNIMSKLSNRKSYSKPVISKMLESATRSMVKLMSSIAQRNNYHMAATFERGYTYATFISLHYSTLVNFLEKKGFSGYIAELKEAKKIYDSLHNEEDITKDSIIEYVEACVQDKLCKVKLEAEKTKYDRLKQSIESVIEGLKKKIQDVLHSSFNPVTVIQEVIRDPVGVLKHIGVAIQNVKAAVKTYWLWAKEHPFQAILLTLTSAAIGVVAAHYLPLTGFLGNAVEFVGGAIGGGVGVVAPAGRALVRIKEPRELIDFHTLDLAEKTRKYENKRRIYERMQATLEATRKEFKEEIDSKAKRPAVDVSGREAGGADDLERSLVLKKQLAEAQIFFNTTEEEGVAMSARHERELAERSGSAEARQRARETRYTSARLLAEMALVTEGGSGDTSRVVAMSDIDDGCSPSP